MMNAQNGVSRRTLGVFTAVTAFAAGAVRPRPLQADEPLAEAVIYSSGYVEDPSTYFDMYRPARATGKPTLVLVCGGAHTGSCYLTTADGRPGWAFSFLRAGYPVVIVDWPGTGRSGYIADADLTGEVVCRGLGKVIASLGHPVVLITHSMSGAYGWKLLETHGQHIARLVAVAPGPPGNIQPLPEIVSETPQKIEIRGTTNYALDPRKPFVSTPGFVAGKLIGKSEQFPRETTNHYTATLIPIAPRLLQERLNLKGSQLKIAAFNNYRDKPVLIVTGSNDTDHPRDLDQQVADWLKSTGAKVDYWFLSDKGIVGNGHMMMMERNSDVIAQSISTWIE